MWTEVLEFVKLVGVPGAVAFALIFHTGSKIECLTRAVLELKGKLVICPLLEANKTPNTESPS